MLTLHQGVPVDYRTLLPHLLTPATWAQKGSIPGLIALLRAFLACDAAPMVESNQCWASCSRGSCRAGRTTGEASSSCRASCGCIVRLVVLDRLNIFCQCKACNQYFRQIIMTLLTWMQQNKTKNVSIISCTFCCTCLRSTQMALLWVIIISSKLSIEIQSGQ